MERRRRERHDRRRRPLEHAATNAFREGADAVVNPRRFSYTRPPGCESMAKIERAITDR
jgi:hypothetical protein